MARQNSKGVANNATDTVNKKSSLKIGRRQKFVVGILLIFFSLALLLSFISYFITGNADQSAVSQLANRSLNTENWLGKIGAFLADFFLYQGFGVTSFLLVRVLFLVGAYLVLDMSLAKLKKNFFWDGFLIIVGSISFGFLWDYVPQLGGVIGYEMNLFIQDYIGKTGTLLVLLFGIFIFLVFKLNVSPDTFTSIFEKSTQSFKDDLVSEASNTPVAAAEPTEDKIGTEDELPIVPLPNKEDDFLLTEDEEEISNIELKTYPNSFEINKEALKPTISNASELNLEPKLKSETPEVTNFSIEDRTIPNEPFVNEDAFVIEKVEEEVLIEENLAARLVQDFGEFDPTLELSHYQFPPIDLLKEYSSGGITINQAELEENKNKIVDTLKNYSIGISQIKATVGPTVTLYEIVPDAGIRISKIKNLEDDIALSLSALGIRIIAPIPGKGTIGIEVPNNNPTMVSMKSVISSPKFQTAEMELPIALGKTISNETFVVDLAKMPHLLMAGATGQGKSVGLNAVLTSLLYKKHPAEVKFVLVDPKKVELTLFNKIERHYLAKLPDGGDAIITDNTKVINTLNSLCIEMDNRYSLLKDAMVRNIKEYNEKFRQRKLNPENGHRFLPYIVLVVDEFADLIMTAGKEVEMPIARLAQLARAIGIHLIIATQRPSVNVITGMIKANLMY